MSFSSSTSLPIFPNAPILHNSRTTLFTSTFPFSSSPKSPGIRTLVCFAAQFDRNESLWLREEQRWLREEQRWLREEQRWARERDALLRRVAELELQIQAMDRRSSVDASAEVTDAISGLIEVLKEKSMIAEASSSASPMFLEEKKRDDEVEDEVVVERVIRVVSDEDSMKKSESNSESRPKKTEKKKRRSLKQGSEGDEVRALQEALQKLGFYSGEEDIEFSCFSTGTERAVKTWQSSLGAREDGIMTEELLERLFTGEGEADVSGSVTDSEEKAISTPKPKEDANGAAASSSLGQISKTRQSSVKEGKGVSGPKVTQPRVFLLGENRWEDSSRLGVGNNKPKQFTNKCIACRGEGRLLCTECDGTGEPNIEPQFMEWVDEGTTCPYCEGTGYTICDVCNDKSGV